MQFLTKPFIVWTMLPTVKLVGSEERRLGKNKPGIQRRKVLRPGPVCPGTVSFLLAILLPH